MNSGGFVVAEIFWLPESTWIIDLICDGNYWKVVATKLNVIELLRRGKPLTESLALSSVV